PIYPDFLRNADRWLDPAVRPFMLRQCDGDGFARADAWAPGIAGRTMRSFPAVAVRTSRLDRDLSRAMQCRRLAEDAIVRLLRARGDEVSAVVGAADELRQSASGPLVRYVVNRNINYTNICEYRCAFCA